MDNNITWVWWAFTAAICAWKLVEGLVRPHRMLEWPFLACAMWAYFYVYMAYKAKTSMPEYLGNGISNIGQLMPLLCLVGILIGWRVGTRRRARRVPDTRAYRYFNFWMAGMFFLMVGAAGAYSVMHARTSGTLNYEESSGYWILLFYVGYPGLAMTIWALLKMDPHVRKYLWVVTLIAFAAFMFPHVIDARRGPLFPAIMILLLVPPLSTGRSPNPLIFFGVLVTAGVVMLAFLQIRSTIYDGGTWGQALHRLNVSAAVEEKAEQPEDNEYINNCQLIGTIFQNGKYQYGTAHLGLLVHWVPRSIWKNKRNLGEGSYSQDQLYDDIASSTGFDLLRNTGAASGGVADTFLQYGVFCPLFWFVLSWGMGAVYGLARMGNPRWLFCYVGFICASHWLVSQALAGAFVPGMFFEAVPFVVFSIHDLFIQQSPARPRRRVSVGNPRYQAVKL